MHTMVAGLFPKILSCHLEYTKTDLSTFSVSLSSPFITTLSFFTFCHQYHHSTLRTSVQYLSPIQIYSQSLLVFSVLSLCTFGEHGRWIGWIHGQSHWQHGPVTHISLVNQLGWGFPLNISQASTTAEQRFTSVHQSSLRSSSSTSILSIPRLPVEPLLKTQASMFSVYILQTCWCNLFLVYVDPQISFK